METSNEESYPNRTKNIENRAKVHSRLQVKYRSHNRSSDESHSFSTKLYGNLLHRTSIKSLKPYRK